MSKISRKNTLEYRFDRTKARPDALEVYEWLNRTLQIKGDQVEGVQLDCVLNAVFVKFIDESTLERVLRQHGEMLSMKTKKGDVIDVKVKKCDENRKMVRILNLPFEVENHHIRDALLNYGKVESVIEEKFTTENSFFPDLKTGVRIVSIVLRRHIPSFLEIKGNKALIMYSGQPKTCVICNSETHLRNDCPKLKAAAIRINKLQDNMAIVLTPNASVTTVNNGVNHNLQQSDLFCNYQQQTSRPNDKKKTKKVNQVNPIETNSNDSSADSQELDPVMEIEKNEIHNDEEVIDPAGAPMETKTQSNLENGLDTPVSLLSQDLHNVENTMNKSNIRQLDEKDYPPLKQPKLQ